MAIGQVDRDNKDLNEGWAIYNALVTALLTQHDSDGAHKSAADVILKALFDANTILAANSDNTPAALTIAASRIVGRASSGDIAALTAAQVLTILGLDADLANLTAAEVDQLKNIGTTIISAARWGYLGACTAGAGQLLAALTAGESTQLEKIGTTTISAAQWGHLGACGAGGGQLLAALTTGESDQLELIGTTTISAAQWGILGALASHPDKPVVGTDTSALLTLNNQSDVAWTELDANTAGSGNVPTDATGVWLWVGINSDTQGAYIGLRKNGETDADQQFNAYAFVTGKWIFGLAFVGLDGDGIFEYTLVNCGTTDTDVRIKLAGWVEPS